MKTVVSTQLAAAATSRFPARGLGNCRISPAIISRSTRSKSNTAPKKMTEATTTPLSGLWQPTHLQRLHYGPGSVSKHLLSSLPRPSSRVFIITGNSLATKTPLVKEVEALLGERHAGTFAGIGEHAPVGKLEEGIELVEREEGVDTVVSIGGGSPIDSAKAMSYRLHEKKTRGQAGDGSENASEKDKANADTDAHWLHHIAIPTTLSASECTLMAGYTASNGVKTGVRDPHLAPHVVLYDSGFALHTPPQLWTSTGLRALDHALELLYHPSATEMPARTLCLHAAADLFRYLPAYARNPTDQDVITRLQLAAFASLGFLGCNVVGGLGLSHALGYALGSPYGIPHGVTSCLTLGHVVKLKARDAGAASQIARLLPFIGETASGDASKDAERVGERVLGLVRELGLESDLRNYNVGKEEIPVITKRATGQEEGEVYEAVEGLVRGLFP